MSIEIIMDMDTRKQISSGALSEIKKYSKELNDLNYNLISVMYDSDLSENDNHRINVVLYNNGMLDSNNSNVIKRTENRVKEIIPKTFEYDGISIPVSISYGRVYR